MGDVDSKNASGFTKVVGKNETNVMEVLPIQGKDRAHVFSMRHPQPGKRVIGMIANFVDGGGSNVMNVDGSSVPVTFTAGPTVASETWLVTGVVLAMNDTGTQNFSDFGAIGGGLTNGLLLQADIAGSTHSIANIKTNSELISNFESVFRGSGNSFISDANYVACRTRFSEFVELNQSTTDRYKITVRDDLSLLTHLRVRLLYIRVL